VSTLEEKTFKPICRVSALHGDGLSTLEVILISEFKEFTKYTPEKPIVFTKRQQDYVSKAINKLTECIQVVKEEKKPESYLTLLNDIKQNLLNCIDSSIL